MPPRTLLIGCLVLAALAAAVFAARSGAAPAAEPAIALLPSFQPPAGADGASLVEDRGWTYDSALAVIAYATAGRTKRAGELLAQLSELQNPDGSLDGSYSLTGGAGDKVIRGGVIAWTAAAATRYRDFACSGSYDQLLRGTVRWLLNNRDMRRGSATYGMVLGGPGMDSIAAEHNLVASAAFAHALDETGGSSRGCKLPLRGLPRRQLARANRLLDAAINRTLLARDDAGRVTAIRQGPADDAIALDAQAYGALWLIRHGRLEDARRVIDNADRLMLLARPDGRVGYKPFAEPWGPDVLWTEGTLQMAFAKIRLGQRPGRLLREVRAWAATSVPGMLLHSDRDDLGSPAGDYHRWPASAPAAWLTLSQATLRHQDRRGS